jgi:hypothetical protein
MSRYTLIIPGITSDLKHRIHFGARTASKKKPEQYGSSAATQNAGTSENLYGRNAVDAFPTSTMEELLSSNQMKSGAQSYTTAQKPKVPRPSDSVNSKNASSQSSETKPKSWFTQLKFKGDEGKK